MLKAMKHRIYPNKSQKQLKKPLNIRKFNCPHCGKEDIDRDINASVNIKNYGLGQVDNRNTVGTIGI